MDLAEHDGTMRVSARFQRRGVTLLETMMAMAVLLVGMIGALAALQAGARETKVGQFRQQKMLLADATLQRVRSIDKALYFSGASAVVPSSDPSKQPVGGGNWVVDASASTDLRDFSTNAYFKVLADGTITKDTTVTPGTACNAAGLPVGTVCRETFTHLGAPFGAGNGADAGFTAPTGTRVATTWVRVSQKLAPNALPEVDLVLSQVIIQ